MITLAPNLPPATLTDEALKLCASLLQIASEPAGTAQRLQQLNEATATLRTAIDEQTAAKKSADDAAAALAGVQAQAADLAVREESLLKATTQLSVANHANASREESLTLREQSLDRRQTEIDAKEKALAAKVEAYRQALAG
jgi:hypothetical protein